MQYKSGVLRLTSQLGKNVLQTDNVSSLAFKLCYLKFERSLENILRERMMPLSVFMEFPLRKIDDIQLFAAAPLTDFDLYSITMEELKNLLEEELLEENMDELKKFLLENLLEENVEEQVEENGDKLVSLEKIKSHWYKLGTKIGQGRFGVIFEAISPADGLRVALKYAAKRPDNICLPDHPNSVPLEVGLMRLVNKDSRSSNIIQLIDWMEQAEYYVMVLERFLPCMDLLDYLKSRDYSITEKTARIIMRQVIQAAVTCCEQGVFHRDIKLENILINSDTMQIKLIDFGSGELMKSCAYNYCCGTDVYLPPEYTDRGQYHAKPATVYSLGMVLYRLICEPEVVKQDKTQIDFTCWSQFGLTKECCDFICGCLRSDPVLRLPLEKLLPHRWLKGENIRRIKSVELSRES